MMDKECTIDEMLVISRALFRMTESEDVSREHKDIAIKLYNEIWKEIRKSMSKKVELQTKIDAWSYIANDLRAAANLYDARIARAKCEIEALDRENAKVKVKGYDYIGRKWVKDILQDGEVAELMFKSLNDLLEKYGSVVISDLFFYDLVNQGTSFKWTVATPSGMGNIIIEKI